MKNIYFVSEGNNNIGFGHLYRCSSLIDMLSVDFSCHLLLFNTQKVPIKKEYVMFENQNNVLTFIESTARENEIVVIDSYSIKDAFLAELKALQLITVSINDIPENSLLTDVVINHTFNLDANRFNLPNNVRLLLGEQYLLLRNAFIEEKKKAYQKTKKEQIFICFGGADPSELSIKTLEFLKVQTSTYHFIIATSSKETYDKIVLFCEKERLNNVTVCQSLNEHDLIKIIRDSKLAIVPSSTMALECMCVGVNILTGYFVDNQQTLAKHIQQSELGINLGNLETIDIHEFNDGFQKAINDNFVIKQKEIFKTDSKKIIIREFKKL